MLSDLRFAVRLFFKQPGFTIVAVLTMAIAIGANVALFSAVNAVVLRPIDYPNPDELVRVWEVNQARGIEFPAVSLPRYRYLRDHTTMLESVALTVDSAVTITEPGEAEQVPNTMATSSLFHTLGLHPAFGRFFNAEEDREGGPNVALISNHLWQTRFGGSHEVLGHKLLIDGVPFEIIGVLPPQMPVPFNQAEIFMPRPEEVPFISKDSREGGAAVWTMTARLKPGITRDAAERQVTQLCRQILEKYPGLIDVELLQLRRFSDEIIPAQLRLASGVLVAAVAAILLIACANIANLSLARLTARTKEIAVRASLGAGRTAIIRQFLIESLILALAGGALGLLLAFWGMDGIRLLGANQLPRVDHATIDTTTMVFAIGVTAVATILVGIYPAWQATRTDVQIALKDNSRGNVGAHSNKLFRSLLVVGEVATSLVLLIGASLLLYSFAKLQHTRLGFNLDRVAAGAINLPAGDYGTPEKQREFVRLLQEKLDAAPELAAGGVGFGMPLTGSIAFTPFSVAGQPILPVGERKLVAIRHVTPGFFRALSIAPRDGRLLGETDNAKAPLVGVINASFAKKIFPDRSAVGQLLLFGANAEKKCEIVGVIDDVKSAGVAAAPLDEIYFAHAQRGGGFVHVVAKAKPGLSASAVLPVLRRAVREIDPHVAVATPQTGAELLAQDLQGQRALSALLGSFAAIAAILAVIGIYSVIAYNVTQRRAEIGVRLALGATAGNIFQLILKNAGTLVGAGLALGLIGSFASSRVLRNLLFEVQPFDPVVFGIVAIAFAAVAVLAAVIPARRAMAVDPLTAVRSD